MSALREEVHDQAGAGAAHAHPHVHGQPRLQVQVLRKALGTQINRRRHERRHEAGLKRKLEDPAGSKAPSDGAPPQDGTAPGLGQDLTLSSEGVPGLGDSFLKAVEENGRLKSFTRASTVRKVFGTHTNMRRHPA